jgi:ABC-type branched-subunit amino acid transport system ATPase component
VGRREDAGLGIEDLRVTCGGVPVLRGITLHVPRGATAALVGRNGAGKTTTLRAVMGLVPAASGRILLDGEPLGVLPAHLRSRRGIGYAPEDRQLVSALTVEENLLLPAEAGRLGPAAAAVRLGRVYALLPECAAMRSRPAGTLSGGQQKLVALARAIAAATRLLLLDEPFQGLAPPLAARCAEALQALRRDDPGLAVLVTESTPRLLERLDPDVHLLERGEIAAAAGNGRGGTAGERCPPP